MSYFSLIGEKYQCFFCPLLKLNFIIFPRSIEFCSIYCLQNSEICNAFEFINGTCSVSHSPTFIKNSKYTKRKKIWIDPSKTSVTVTTCKKLFFQLFNYQQLQWIFELRNNRVCKQTILWILLWQELYILLCKHKTYKNLK